MKKKLLILGDKSIYIKRLADLVYDEFDILLVCRNSSGLDENQFNKNVKFTYLSSDSVFYKLKAMIKIMHLYKPDTLYLHFMVRDSVIPSVLKLFFSFRYIIGIVGSDINVYSGNRINYFCQYLGMKKADSLLLIIDTFIEKIKKYSLRFEKKCEVISWGVEYSFFSDYKKKELIFLKEKYKIPVQAKLILSFRSLRPIYNQITLINAIPSIFQQEKDAFFIIVTGTCSKEYKDEICTRINELNVDDRVLIIDEWVSRNLIRQLLNMSFVSVNIPLHDGLPASLLESMCTRSIPVCSNLENYHDFFKDNINGFVLSDNRSAFDLAEAIVKILKLSRMDRKRIISNNRKYIKNNQNWERQKEILKEFFRR